MPKPTRVHVRGHDEWGDNVELHVYNECPSCVGGLTTTRIHGSGSMGAPYDEDLLCGRCGFSCTINPQSMPVRFDGPTPTEEDVEKMLAMSQAEQFEYAFGKAMVRTIFPELVPVRR